MACCAIGPCGRRDSAFPGPGMRFVEGRWHCYLCYLMPTLFSQPPPSITPEERAQRNPERDGAPKLAAERERGDLAFRKRQRAGPNWIPRERRAE